MKLSETYQSRQNQFEQITPTQFAVCWPAMSDCIVIQRKHLSKRCSFSMSGMDGRPFLCKCG